MSAPHPFLHGDVLFEALQKQQFPQFGYCLRSYRFHPADGHYVIDRTGHAVGEVWPDRLVLRPPKDWGMESTYRQLFRVPFKHRNEVSAAGLKHQFIEVNYVTKILYQQGIVVYNDGRIQGIIEQEKVVEKDNAKYRAFNKRLKQLKAVIHTQIAAGAYKAWESLRWRSQWPQNTALRDEILAIFAKHGNKSCYNNEHRVDILSKIVDDWIATSDPTLPRAFAQIAFINNISEAKQGSHEDLRRRVTNAMKQVQINYLREHCVTIRESNNSLREPSDQESELQSTAGLREVQVSGEAEVC